MYGVMAYHVTARTREIGIRMAMGAQRTDVFRLVIGQGVRVTLAGIVAGLMLSALAGRLLASLLYGVSATDAATWASAVAVWLIVAPMACSLPALRAMRVEPLLALRQD
jgi:ABC-type antimicrobial peptide transport system permease subunit